MRRFYFMLLAFISLQTVYAQNPEIKGVVTDEYGEGLPGVTVSVNNGEKGTITDVDGNYLFSGLSTGSVLKFTYIGYEPQEVKIQSQTVINIQMVPSSIILDEVVAVGYAVQKKVNLTGAVESVNVTDLLDKPVGVTSEALQGVSAGLTVTRSSGKPGDGSTLRIRGIGTLGDSNPLVLIDGVEGDIDAVDPNMIENISVLKDAASAAIYGSRAANGVILVTTKRGAKNQQIKVDYNLHMGWQALTDKPKFTDGYTYMVMHNEAMRNEEKKELYSAGYLQEYLDNKAINPDLYPDVDWQKEIYTESGFQQRHSISVSGGTEKLSSMAMFSFNEQNGIVANYNYKQYNLRFNNDYIVNRYLRLKADVSLKKTGSDTPYDGENASSGIFYGVNRAAPIYAALLSDGRYAANALGGSNTLANVHARGFDKNNQHSFLGRFSAVITPIEGASVDVSYMPEYSQSGLKKFEKPIALYTPGFEEPTYSVPQKSYLEQRESKSWRNQLTAVATYQKTIGTHDFGVLAGYEQIDYRNEWLQGSRDNFTFVDYPEMNSGSLDNVKNGGNAEEWALRSYFGRVNYAYASRYLFEANVRHDGSSRFAPGHRYGTFPSFSVGWRLSEENFLKNIKPLSNLKLRASWGQLGNQKIGTYPYLSTVDLANMGFIFGGNPVDGAGITRMGNSIITWETAETKNMGVDFGFFGNQLTGSFEYYIRDTKDILLNLPIPGTIGLSAPAQNAGEVSNKGWDLNLNYRDKIGELGYSIGFILSDVKNEVTSLKDAGPFITGYTIRKEGYPIDSYFGYQAAGIFKNDDEVKNHPTQIGAYGPGDIIYKNQNSDNVINADDRVVIGNPIPRYNYSINLALNYKNFDFSMFMQGVGKRDVYLEKNAVWAFYSGGKVQDWMVENRWTPENVNASYPRFIANTSHNNYQASDFWIYSAAYLRIKNVTLGYTIPKELLRRLSIQNMRLYVTTNNLFTFDKMPSGIDPESPAGDINGYPLTTTYAIGVNVSF
ncbi:MAG: TonB-dependent receptor [Tannerella sp.]|jgi:TonB-linked SusC/RagA family outer membrane protein|nr:TonB-dependent receptor [Tannerella sp.]